MLSLHCLERRFASIGPANVSVIGGCLCDRTVLLDLGSQFTEPAHILGECISAVSMPGYNHRVRRVVQALRRHPARLTARIADFEGPWDKSVSVDMRVWWDIRGLQLGDYVRVVLAVAD